MTEASSQPERTIGNMTLDEAAYAEQLGQAMLDGVSLSGMPGGGDTIQLAPSEEARAQAFAGHVLLGLAQVTRQRHSEVPANPEPEIQG